MYRAVGDQEMHAVLEEGQQHFYSEPEALAWLAWQQQRMRWVYTSDGLVIGWYDSKGPRKPAHAFIAGVWQFYIQGRKPTKLGGANDEKIRVTMPVSPGPAIGTQALAPPAVVNNRSFAGKALDYMKEFNISAAQVEEVIEKAKPTVSGNYFWHHGWTLKPMIKFSVCADSAGKVWLVIP